MPNAVLSSGVSRYRHRVKAKSDLWQLVPVLPVASKTEEVWPEEFAGEETRTARQNAVRRSVCHSGSGANSPVSELAEDQPER
ncbi:Uncharacterised protein [Escherichia coli]|uniref:Uncharacterized protein n=1 Tax=Escherichia coli TaxID=562 RepID=A0A376D5Y0_ECOLX|nr:Uncharacterised protein [Escherichia coli]